MGNRIRVIECENKIKKKRTFPCILVGVSGHYYYATNKDSSFNLTSGTLMSNDFLDEALFKEIECLTLSL